jgi:hypothetical protein
MAEGMGDHKQRKCNKRILPEIRGETTHETEPNTKLHSLSHGPREHEILPVDTGSKLLIPHTVSADTETKQRNTYY